MLSLIRKELVNLIDRIDAGNTQISETECIKLLEYINEVSNVNEKLSKYQACSMLKISRAKFDTLVANGIIPAGRHQQGFKEKFWFKKDIDKIRGLVNTTNL
jgi:hypothetical protein